MKARGSEKLKATICIRIPEDMEQAVDEWSKRTKIQKAELVREGLRLALARYAEHKHGDPFPGPTA